MPRCRPKACPRRSTGVTSAISASRGGVRSPFPNRSTTRKPITCHAAPVTAMTGRTTTAMKYPSTIIGPRKRARSASRPAPSFTKAAANSAAPSSAPSACAPPPSTPVVQQRVVETAQGEALALRRAEVLPQLEDLAPTHRVAQRVGRLGTVTTHFRFRIRPVHPQVRRHELHCLLERHAARMQSDIEQDTHRTPQQMYALEELLFFGAVEPLFPHHVLTVQRPAFDGERRPHVLAGVRGLLLRVHQVEVVARIPFVQG